MTITIIGGGVYVVPLLLELAHIRDTPSLRVRLSARDHARLSIIARHARKCVAPWAPRWEIRSFASAREAVSGADVVVLLARIGGLEARAHDETFPHAFGCAGDEGLGLGGLANAWRTLPVLEGIAAHIAEAAPGARVLNLMAPLPSTTRLLRDLGLDAIGICELPTTVERELGSPARLQYLGLNHLGWFWPAPSQEASVLSDAVHAGLAHEQTVEDYGAVPLPYYYRVVRPDLGRSLGITAPAGRAHELSRLAQRIFDRMASGQNSEIAEYRRRQTPWFDQALVPMLRSLMTGTEYRSFVNIDDDLVDLPQDRLRRHAGATVAWPPGTVFECRARLVGFEIQPELPRHVPDAVRSFLERTASAADRRYRACRARDLSDLRAEVEALGVHGDRIDDAVREVCRPFPAGVTTPMPPG